MTHSLLDSGYQLVALLFGGVIVRPDDSATGVDKAIQDLWSKYGVRVTRIEIRRGVENIGQDASSGPTKTGFGLSTPRRATAGIDIDGCVLVCIYQSPMPLAQHRMAAARITLDARGADNQRVDVARTTWVRCRIKYKKLKLPDKTQRRPVCRHLQ